MICTSIINKDFEAILNALENCEMAEIRLDKCRLTPEETGICFSSDVPLIATCRIAELAADERIMTDIPQEKRMTKAAAMAEAALLRAIEGGAKYVDLEIEAPKAMVKRIAKAARENGSILIRSFHDFNGTDSLEGLKAVVEKCIYHDAEIVKIATTAESEKDTAKISSLYDWAESGPVFLKGNGIRLSPARLVAFCMGELGRESRLECLKRGAPFTYASLSENEAAAPGQWTADMMCKRLYGDFRFCNATIDIPCSKSFAQRAIIAAAIAEGTSHLSGYEPCGDNESAIAVAEAIGAKVERNGKELTITGIAAHSGALELGRNDEGISLLHTGESGLLTRMMIPLAAELCKGTVLISGEKTLLNRPLRGAKEIMEAVGASIVPAGDAEGTEIKIPAYIEGPLAGGRAEITGKHGSQLISGLLMALPFNAKNSSLIVRDPKSIPYMFITLEVLKKFGIRINNEMLGGRDFIESDGDWSLCSEMVFKIKGGQHFKAADFNLEADWSAAANFLVAGAVFGKVVLKGLDTTSLQADLSIMDILMDAGASLSQMDGDTGEICVQRAPLEAVTEDLSNCPDLFPIVAVLSAFCEGMSKLDGVERLSTKESDRGKAIIEMLCQMGVKASIEGNTMTIEGESLQSRLLNGRLLKGGGYSSHHDHRMVMALKVASLGADSPVEPDDTECVAKSFPSFGELFETLR